MSTIARAVGIGTADAAQLRVNTVTVQGGCYALVLWRVNTLTWKLPGLETFDSCMGIKQGAAFARRVGYETPLYA